jgi:hypothetical protein
MIRSRLSRGPSPEGIDRRPLARDQGFGPDATLKILTERAIEVGEGAGRLGEQGAPGELPGRMEPVKGGIEQVPAVRPGSRERRRDSRQEVDNSAQILLVNIGSRLRGRIVDLSLGGCCIRTDDRFPVGIYTRVEAEFHLEGLPFRLGGVVQRVFDRKTVGIRFLDLSERKRRQVLDLIAEIAESRAAHDPEDSAAK